MNIDVEFNFSMTFLVYSYTAGITPACMSVAASMIGEFLSRAGTMPIGTVGGGMSRIEAIKRL